MGTDYKLDNDHNVIFVITLTNHNRVVCPQGNFTVLDI